MTLRPFTRLWLKDENLDASEQLPAPEVLAAEMAEDLRAALEQFEEVLADLAAPTRSG